jgi:hypothetical protein
MFPITATHEELRKLVLRRADEIGRLQKENSLLLDRLRKHEPSFKMVELFSTEEELQEESAGDDDAPKLP